MAIRHIHPSALAVSFAGSVLIGVFGIMGAANADISSAQREACTPDAFRLCSSAIPDAGKVKTCMLENKANLSERCRAAFQGAPAPKLPSDTVRASPIEPTGKASREAQRKIATPAPDGKIASARKASGRVASSDRHLKTHHSVKTARAYRSGGGGYGGGFGGGGFGGGGFGAGGLYGGNFMSLLRRDRPIRAQEAMGMARQMMTTYRAACGSRSIPAEYCGF